MKVQQRSIQRSYQNRGIRKQLKLNMVFDCILVKVSKVAFTYEIDSLF